MTEKKKGIDSSAILEKVANTSETDRESRITKRRMWISVAVGAVIVGFAGYLVYAFADKTDFDQDIPMSENISRWTPLQWETDGIKDGKGQDFKANGLEWKANQEGQYFTAVAAAGDECHLRMTRLGGGQGFTDQESTDFFTNEFREENGIPFDVSNVFLETTKGVNVEFAKASYTNASDHPTYSYYRASPENDGLMMMIVSCESEESLLNEFPDEGGAEVSELALLKPQAFSPF